MVVPRAEQLVRGLLNLGRVHRTDDREDAVVGAVELLVELPRLIERDLLQLRDLLLGRRGILRVALRERAQVPAQSIGGQLGRLGRRQLQRPEPLRLDPIELVLRIQRLPEDLGRQLERRLEVLGRRRDAGRRARHAAAATAAASAAAPSPTAAAAADVDLRVQLAHLFGQLLARVALRARHQQSAGERRRLPLARQRRLVAEAQIDRRGDDVVRRFLRQDRDLHAVRELRADDALVDVRNRGIEASRRARRVTVLL